MCLFRGTMQSPNALAHWGLVMHISVIKLTFIGLYEGMSPDRRQATIRTNAGTLSIWTLGTNLSEIIDKIHTT